MNKALDTAYYRELVLQHLRNFTACKRDELEAVTVPGWEQPAVKQSLVPSDIFRLRYRQALRRE